jgi:hypothetical protein
MWFTYRPNDENNEWICAGHRHVIEEHNGSQDTLLDHFRNEVAYQIHRCGINKSLVCTGIEPYDFEDGWIKTNDPEKYRIGEDYIVDGLQCEVKPCGTRYSLTPIEVVYCPVLEVIDGPTS